VPAATSGYWGRASFVAAVVVTRMLPGRFFVNKVASGGSGWSDSEHRVGSSHFVGMVASGRRSRLLVMFRLEPLCRLRILWVDGRRISLLRLRHRLLLRIALAIVHDDLHRLRLVVALVGACWNELTTLFLLFTRRWGALAKGGVRVVFVHVIDLNLRLRASRSSTPWAIA